MEIIGGTRNRIVPFRCLYLVQIVIKALWKEAFKSLDNYLFFILFTELISNAIAISCYLFNQATIIMSIAQNVLP